MCVCFTLLMKDPLLSPSLFLSLSSTPPHPPTSLSLSPPYIGGCELQRRQRAVRIPVCADLRRGNRIIWSDLQWSGFPAIYTHTEHRHFYVPNGDPDLHTTGKLFLHKFSCHSGVCPHLKWAYWTRSSNSQCVLWHVVWHDRLRGCKSWCVFNNGERNKTRTTTLNLGVTSAADALRRGVRSFFTHMVPQLLVLSSVCPHGRVSKFCRSIIRCCLCSSC